MGVGFFGRLFSKGSKVSPDIKSVKPNLTKTVKQTKQDEFRKRYTALDKAEGKIKSGKKMIKEGQKERTKMVDTNRAFQFKGGSYHAIQPGKDPKKEYKGLLKEKKAKGSRVGRKFGNPKPKTNVEKIKKAFDPRKSDLNKDGRLTSYEKKRGMAIAKAMRGRNKNV
jgi:hypothetical protein